jgi:hypothetical protein
MLASLPHEAASLKEKRKRELDSIQFPFFRSALGVAEPRFHHLPLDGGRVQDLLGVL